jgi:4-diphosphocytidyl-2-C-methyl-D-erythritol kinase
MSRIAIRAFAKINLSLRIAERRADGFHEVRTILQSIDLADRVICESHRGAFDIICAAPGVPADRTNLVWDAARREGPPRDARVTLEKHSPIKAGLGGGSSDAAAALFALRRVWKLKIADDALYAIAAEVGSDVPYFFVGGTALGLGRGDEVYPLDDLPRLWVVLVFPPFGIATADAYAWLDEMRTRTSLGSTPSYLEQTWLRRVVPLVNDLERPVIERHPVVAKLKDRLTKMGASMAAMSGSGSTVFGVFQTARVAEATAQKLRRSGASVLVTRFLPRRNR